MTRQEQEVMLENNLKLVFYVLIKRFPTYAYNEDIYQIGCIGLWQAVKGYKDSVGAFSSFACACIYNQVAMALRKQRKSNDYSFISFDEPLFEGSDLSVSDSIVDVSSEIEFTNIEYSDTKKNVIKAINRLNSTEQRVLNLSMSGMNQGDIAKIMSSSQPNISRSLSSARAKLKRYLRGTYQ